MAQSSRQDGAWSGLRVIAVLLVLASPAAAQTTSTIEGTVSDASGAVIPGAEVNVRGETISAERRATTDAKGFYRVTALPAGTYTVTVTFSGLSPNAATLDVTLNRVVTFDVTMQVGGVQETVAVSVPALDPSTSATATTITPREIAELPVNGRNYLDLLQLVPGVAINRQVDPNTDRSNPVLGERSGNNNFLLDGQSNKDTVNGGPAQQFNQETIAEFQVLTSGYKAEFGQASGAIVNVITKSGSNLFNGVGSLFLRDDALDASNSLDETRTDPLPLRRHDTSLALGGPLAKDKVFFFGSAEHIGEERQLDFKYPDTGNTVVNQLLREQEAALRRADGALGDSRILQARRARRPASIEPADQLYRQRCHQLPAAVVSQQLAVGAQRHRHAADAAGGRRLGPARQSGQPVRACPARGISPRGQRDPPVTE